ncbi:MULTISPECIES: hypothetical protein [Sphingomonas]|jgi:hypothetical protein|nr:MULTISPECIES: hypothetical protein [Sphingomonas]MDK8187400.1 hypothetical protein [Sphingomonas zeae]MDK8217155.1 hypothetical protein [Sphingomonas sp. UMB7805-LC452B]
MPPSIDRRSLLVAGATIGASAVIGLSIAGGKTDRLAARLVTS